MADDEPADRRTEPASPPRRTRSLIARTRHTLRRLWLGARLAPKVAPGYLRALPAGRPWFVMRARLLPMDVRDRLARHSLAQRIMDHQPTTRTRYVLLVRHGQTHFNVEGRLPGQLPGVSLTNEGRRQAHQAAVALSALPLSAIVTSPLERARDTAEIIARGWALPVRLDPRLMDTDVGHWAGQKIDDVAKNDPAWRPFTEHPTEPPPGVESLADVQTRAVAAVEAALDDPTTGDYLVIVAHADVVKLIIAQYTGVMIDGVRFMSIANASISALAFPEVIPALPARSEEAAPTDSATDLAAEIGANGARPHPAAEQPQARPTRLTPTLLAVNWTQTPRWLVAPMPTASVSVAGVPTPTASEPGQPDAANLIGDTEGYMSAQEPPALPEAAPIDGAPTQQASAQTTGEA